MSDYFLKLVLSFSLSLFGANFSWGKIDQNGNGISDLWEQMYAVSLSPTEDSDFDGVPNYDEGLAGTDPTDPTSRFVAALDTSQDDDTMVVVQAKVEPGKVYTLEEFSVSESRWIETPGATALEESGTIRFSTARDQAVKIYRVLCQDIDGDGDGLSRWEEERFGWSDTSMSSSGQSGFLDYAAALKVLEGEGSVTLASGVPIQRVLPSIEVATKLLTQASFGVTQESLDEVQQKGVVGWIEDQLELPTSLTRAVMLQNSQPFNTSTWRKGWWRASMLGEDQLRLRLAYALSQIFVIQADDGSLIGDNSFSQAAYYDLLVEGAFGTYRNLLEKVTYAPAMGVYLSSFRNRKADVSLNRFPDENFAREIMQLFSIGLWKLDSGGRPLLNNGKPIPTYDNDVITEMAKIFTGLSNGTYNRGRNNDVGFFAPATGKDFQKPMKMFDDEHEMGSKTIFDGIVISNDDEMEVGNADISDTLDALAAHPNAAPFISKLLIQRFTSSNPSPEYVQRVGHAWTQFTEDGEGSLANVITAILLDKEARNQNDEESIRGKVREPLLRLTSILRTFDASDTNGNFPISSSSSVMIRRLGQFTLLSPTVFNFYSPTYSPAGELSSLNLFAPELEIATVSRLIETDNLFREAIDTAFYNTRLNLAELLPYAEDTDDLLDRLSVLMLRGGMTDDLRNVIFSVVDQEQTPLLRARMAIHLISQSPDYVVLN